MLSSDSTQSDYILEDNFVDPGTCDRLIAHFELTNRIRPLPNVNPMYNNRVVYYEGLTLTHEDREVQTIMRDIHERVANRLSTFYTESKRIWPEATHLVKWPAGTSLGNHADNAYEDGSPNYVSWRTHSAVMYLNDDYLGGEFYFKKELPKLIKPQKGLLVAFTAGINHTHGVQMIRAGTRYAMPMWFTQDRTKAYPEYQGYNGFLRDC
jgi:hypothetical protein